MPRRYWIAALLVCSLAPITAAQEITINLGHVLAITEPTHIVAEQVAERVEERTGGQVRINVFPASQLGGNADVIEQAYLGAPVVANVEPGFVSTEYGVPDFAMLGGPYFLRSADQVDSLVSTDAFRMFQEELRKNGLVILAFNWYFGERHIIGDRAYSDPADLEGVKVRVAPSPVWIDTFDALEATGVTLEWAEVYGGLQQGVVDAAEAPLSTLYASRLYEVADTITLTGHFKAVLGWVMGVEYFDSLPEDVQAILLEEFQRGGVEMTAITLAQEQEYQGRLEDEGVEFFDADIEAYAAKTQSFYSRFTPGLYEEVQSQLD